MSENTMLYHGVPAILRKDNWVLISPSFEEIVHIEKGKINDPDIYAELQQKGFFERSKSTVPDVFHIVLITTSDCNLACRYCFANSGERTIVMSHEIAFAAVREAITRAGGKKLSIAFFGGEPTLTANLIKDIVSFSKDEIIGKDIQELQFSITTNGVMSSSFLDFLVEEDFLLTVSSDGLPIVQNYQRPLKSGGESSPMLERTIRFLSDAQKEFMVRATVTDYSVEYMVPTIEWLHKLGGTQIQFEPISIAGRAAMQTKGAPMKRPPVRTFAYHLKMAIQKAAELNVSVINSAFMNLMSPPVEFCDGNINYRFAVSYTGDITTCVEVQEKCHPVFGQFTVGKLGKISACRCGEVG